MNHKFSIRGQLLRSLAISLALLYCLGGACIFLLMKRFSERQFEQGMVQQITSLASEIEIDQQGRLDNEFDRLQLKIFNWEIRNGYYQLWNHLGETVALSKSLGKGESLPYRELRADEIHIESLKLPDGASGKIAYLSFIPRREEGDVPDGTPIRPKTRSSFALALPDTEVHRTLRVLLWGLEGTGIGLAFVAWYMVRIQVERVIRPVGHIAEFTREIEAEQLDLRLPSGKLPEELAPLVIQFNTLLDRLESAFDRERRYSAAIAHELRTPIAELAILAENALSPTDDDSLKEDPGEVYLEMQRIGIHLGNLIEVISAIHQAASGRTLVHPVRLQPATIISQTIEKLNPTRQKGGHKFLLTDDRTDPDEPMTTDETLFRAILENLIGNAIDHSTSNTRILCKLAKHENDSVVFQIENSSEELDAGDVTRIPEPFWQKSHSRNLPGKFGLGLTLVDYYVKLLDSEISYKFKDGKFTVSLNVKSLADCSED